jgi:hypothetical protein
MRNSLLNLVILFCSDRMAAVREAMQFVRVWVDECVDLLKVIKDPPPVRSWLPNVNYSQPRLQPVNKQARFIRSCQHNAL